MAATLLAALSVSDKVKTYGAYAGFAAILGLGVMALLYFAQARELKRLREWAGRAPERSQDAGAGPGADALAPAVQRRPVGAARPGPAQPGAVARPGLRPPPPSAPSGPPAPTRPTPPAEGPGVSGVPAPGPGARPGAPSASPATARAAAGAAPAASPAPSAGPPVPGPAPPVAPGAADRVRPEPDGEPARSSQAPATGARNPPVSPAAPATGAATAPRTAAAARRSAATTSLPARTPPPSARRGPASPRGAPATPGAPGRAPDGRAGAPARPAGRGHREAASHGRRPVALALGVGAFVVVLAILLISGVLGGGGGSKRAAAPAARAPAAAAGTGATPVSPSKIRVAVLNGTSTAGLARTVADRLVKGGYRIGTVTNAPSHAHAATTVAYGAGRRSQAQAVAQLLAAASPDAVRPLDPATRTIAHGAPVVVTVGSDSRR